MPCAGATALALAELESACGRVDRARELLARAREVFALLGMERFAGFADEVERGLAARAC